MTEEHIEREIQKISRSRKRVNDLTLKRKEVENRNKFHNLNHIQKYKNDYDLDYDLFPLSA
jgi:ribosomal 30S subunit maturation factor RimM